LDYDSKDQAFCLEVKGDSMISPVRYSIAQESLILVEIEGEVAPRKLAVSTLPDRDEATLKDLVSDGGKLS
jgi:SOS-response transcriptional repressor LexA